MVETVVGANATEIRHHARFDQAIKSLFSGNFSDKDMWTVVSYLGAHEGSLVSFRDTYNTSFPNEHRFQQGTIVGIVLPERGYWEVPKIAKNVPTQHKLYLTLSELQLFSNFRDIKIKDPYREVKFTRKK